MFLIGTAHISEVSANEVTEMISLVKPQTVFVELDPARAAKLRTSANTNEEDDFEKSFRQALDSFLSGGIQIPGLVGAGGPQQDMLKNGFAALYNILKRYGYVPGVEMIAAMNEASRINANLYCGDRDINDTMRDLRRAFQFSMLMKAMSTPPPPELEQIFQNAFNSDSGTLGQKVETIKNREHARLMTGWMKQAMPDIADIMLHKRDHVMASNLRKHCGKGKVVAVVGLAHVDGIEREWEALDNSLRD